MTKKEIENILEKIKFATTKSEAKRMILEKGIKINTLTEIDVNKIIDLKDSKIIQYGKNKFIKCL